MHALWGKNTRSRELSKRERSRGMRKREKPRRSFPEAMRLLFDRLARNGSQPPVCSHLPTGQQDPLQLDWWPRDLQNKPLVYIYRAIRDDFEEWLDGDPCHDACRCENKSEMVWHVLDAVCHGSSQRSPFVHFSHTDTGARFYLKPKGVLVRCNLVEMYYAGAVQQDTIIDVSTTKKWMAFLEHDQSKWGQEVEDWSGHAMKLSTERQELLFKWRGTLPLVGVRTMDAKTGGDGLFARQEDARVCSPLHDED